jgi:hypothetical protein
VSSRRSRNRTGGSWTLAVSLLLVVGAAAAAWHWTGRPLPEALQAWLPQELQAPFSPPTEDVSATPLPASSSRLDRPDLDDGRSFAQALQTTPEAPVTLDESDATWRELASPFAQHPLARRVLQGDDLIRTFVTATLEVSEGRSPRKRFADLELEGVFGVQGDLLYLRVDPASYRRYDPLVDAFVGLDSDNLLDVYTRLESLFDEAYAELGYPGEDFDAVLVSALDRLLDVPVLRKPLALVPRAKTYAFEDPQLESLPGAQRQLLRMGPTNVARVQQKLRELKALLQSRAAER